MGHCGVLHGFCDLVRWSGAVNTCSLLFGRSIERKLRAPIMQTKVMSAQRNSPMQPADELCKPLLQIDPVEFSHKFNERNFLVEHQLQGHPLFEIPRLL